ncbi:MAG: hypothetical protein JSW52_01880 [Candidatus Coatesbacteria bacterium]|nr:MAG: hypothetical protein JSW52_01880 [Candidatus Coatesbacteria bacterium]
MRLFIPYIACALALLTVNVSYAYDFQFYAIDDYDAVGMPGNYLSQACIEGYYFYWAMVEYWNSCDDWAENGGVNWQDWATEDAFVNWTEFAYYAGHGCWDGPVYGDRALMPVGGCNGHLNVMHPAYYEFGAIHDDLKWVAWSACSTLFDGVTDSSYVNWNALSRYFQVFQGLHTLVGHRATMAEGTWTEWSPGFWPWEWFDTTSYNSGVLSRCFVINMYCGYSILCSWFYACDAVLYGGLESGFEAAAICAEPDGWDSGASYPCETILNPHPDYTQSLTGFHYYWYRHGTPTYSY